MDNIINEPIIHRGSKSYRVSDIELEKLGETTVTNNLNYLKVLKRIPTYFETDDLFMCMSLAFNFGELKGRECERDMIKWNALATFEWMKTYYNKNGCFPDTQKDLWEWEKAYVYKLGECHNQLTESEQSI